MPKFALSPYILSTVLLIIALLVLAGCGHGGGGY